MATAKQSHLIILCVSAIFTCIFCVAIASNSTPLLRGPAPYPPEWQWAYQFTNTLSRIWVPGIAGVIGWLGILYFDKKQPKHFFLLFITAFTLLLQLSMLYFSRAGVGVLLERIINPGITGYFTTAVRSHDVTVFLTTYQAQVAHFPMRASDHPPFAILFFSLLLSLSSHLQLLFPFVEKVSPHHRDIALMWNMLMPSQKLAALLSTVCIPLLSTSILIPLYFLTKAYYDRESAIRACFLYSVFPSVSLFLPINDVFLGLFGILGLLGVLLGQKSLRQAQATISYFLSGLAFAVGIFFSASMVVPVLIAVLFVIFSSLRKQQKLLGLLGIFGGLGIIPLFLFLEFHFNTPSALIKITSLQAKRSYLPWVFYDLYDFFIFSGIPMLVATIYILKDMIAKKLKNTILPLSFFIVLFLLDISGFSRAESGRIWMPYMPFLAMIVAGYLTKKKFSSSAIAAFFVLQLIQLVVMQEFWVTLW